MPLGRQAAGWLQHGALVTLQRHPDPHSTIRKHGRLPPAEAPSMGSRCPGPAGVAGPDGWRLLSWRQADDDGPRAAARARDRAHCASARSTARGDVGSLARPEPGLPGLRKLLSSQAASPQAPARGHFRTAELEPLVALVARYLRVSIGDREFVALRRCEDYDRCITA